MSRTLTIFRDPNECGNLYKNTEITFNPGLTILTGCNGSGKTTLLRMMEEQFQKDKTPFIQFNNLHEGGVYAREKAAAQGNIEWMATATMSSEGENIYMNMQVLARDIGRLLTKNKDSENKELWILLDAIDSGLSVDNIAEIKDFFRDIVIGTNPDKEIYVVISANEYEFCRQTDCMDIYLGKYITFKNYESYREFIFKTRERKDKRLEKLKNKKPREE